MIQPRLFYRSWRRPGCRAEPRDIPVRMCCLWGMGLFCRCPGFLQGCRFTIKRHRLGPVLVSVPHHRVRQLSESVPPIARGCLGVGALALHPIPTATLRRCYARCSRIPPCAPELGRLGKSLRDGEGSIDKAMGVCWDIMLFICSVCRLLVYFSGRSRNFVGGV